MDLILYNPKSKNSRGNIQTHKLIKEYKKNNKPFRLKSILKVNDIKQYLDERQHFEKIILLGGDGTVNTLVNNLRDYKLKQEIHLKKNGSGNDYLRTLRLQDEKPQYIIENVMDGKIKKRFINGTGIGLDGLIIDYVDKAKNKGKLSYFISSFKGMLNFVPEPLDVEIDGEKHHFKKAYLCVVNNGMFVGGGMKMTPDSRIDDENLQVIIVHSIKKLFLALIFSLVYVGLHTKITRYVFMRKCKHVKATFTTPQITQSDGEKINDITSIDVKSTGETIQFKSYN